MSVISHLEGILIAPATAAVADPIAMHCNAANHHSCHNYCHIYPHKLHKQLVHSQDALLLPEALYPSWQSHKVLD